MSESTPEAQAEAFRAMRDALQDVVQGMQGDDPNSSYMGRQAASIWADVNRMLQHPATADTPEGELELAVRGRAEGAEVDVERVLAELPGERRKAWVAAPLALGCLPLNLACEHVSAAAGPGCSAGDVCCGACRWGQLLLTTIPPPGLHHAPHAALANVCREP